MAVDIVALEPPGRLHALVVQRLSNGPLGGADRLVIDAAAHDIMTLLDTFVPPADSSLGEAVRRFHDDDWMAGCTLACTGLNAPARAAAARRSVREQVDLAFGESPSEQLMHTTLVRAYLDPPGGGHVAAQRELHLSRATFYRTLRRARARLGDVS